VDREVTDSKNSLVVKGDMGDSSSSAVKVRSSHQGNLL
jgi:hypothetical protein